MTYRSMVTEGGRVLAAAGVPEAELDAWYLLEYLRKREESAPTGSGIFLTGRTRPGRRKRKPIRSSLSAGRNGFRSSRLPGNRNLWAFPFG